MGLRLLPLGALEASDSSGTIPRSHDTSRACHGRLQQRASRRSALYVRTYEAYDDSTLQEEAEAQRIVAVISCVGGPLESLRFEGNAHVPTMISPLHGVEPGIRSRCKRFVREFAAAAAIGDGGGGSAVA